MELSDFYLSTFSESDPELWIGIPQIWPIPGSEKELPDIPAWASSVSQIVWEASGLEVTAGGLGVLTSILTKTAQTAPEHFPGFDVLVHLPEPTSMPLNVYIGEFDASDLSPDEAAEEVPLIAGVEDPEAVEPPVVEAFPSQHLGAGVRVLSYVQVPGENTIHVWVRYGWHVPQLQRQVFLFAFSLDPGHMMSALEDIDQLARSIRFVPR